MYLRLSSTCRSSPAIPLGILHKFLEEFYRKSCMVCLRTILEILPGIILEICLGIFQKFLKKSQKQCILRKSSQIFIKNSSRCAFENFSKGWPRNSFSNSQFWKKKPKDQFWNFFRDCFGKSSRDSFKKFSNDFFPTCCHGFI